jgi:hypothetical protein
MTVAALKTETSTYPTNIFPLPNSNYGLTRQDTFPDELIEKLLSSSLPLLEERLKMVIESSVADAIFRFSNENQEVVDSPFDAIYLSELRMDNLVMSDIQEIQSFSDVQDLSDTITFQDEWEL